MYAAMTVASVALVAASWWALRLGRGIRHTDDTQLVRKVQR